MREVCGVVGCRETAKVRVIARIIEREFKLPRCLVHLNKLDDYEEIK